MYFRKKYIEKYDLQESYNNFKIKHKIAFVNRAPGLQLFISNLNSFLPNAGEMRASQN